MMIRAAISVVLMGCPNSKMVDNNGKYSRLFPKTPLSEAPCLEDQDCVITHLKDGQCCPDPQYSASNLYTRDQFDQLVAHQAQICAESQDRYNCPPHPDQPEHIHTVNKGQCVDQRCVLKKVPTEAPGSPPPRDVPSQTTPPNSPNTTESSVTPTVASPTP